MTHRPSKRRHRRRGRTRNTQKRPKEFKQRHIAWHLERSEDVSYCDGQCAFLILNKPFDHKGSRKAQLPKDLADENDDV